MEFDRAQWLGGWDNFETYIESADPHMALAWAEAEEACRQMPGPMFAQGAKAFWRRACRTQTAENPVTLAGWEISAAGDGLAIRWLAPSGGTLADCAYELAEMVPKGLEGKENYLFLVRDAGGDCPFRCLLSMAPMPDREARLRGGYLSHLHFQFAPSPEALLRDGKLLNPAWYATMCAGEGTLLDRCNVVRGLHRLPLWAELPDIAQAR